MDRRKKILIVDDEVEILKSLKRLLRNESYEVDVAENGHQALELLNDSIYDLVISDQRMPTMSGTEFLKVVKDKTPDIIRMILTGNSEKEDILQAINEASVFKVCTKPWNPEEMKLDINKALEYKKVLEINCSLKSIFQNIMEGIFVCDFQGNTIMHNPEFLKLTGLKQAVGKSEHFKRFRLKKNNVNLLQHISNYVKEVGNWSGEVLFQKEDGTRCVFMVYLFKILCGFDNEQKIAGVFEDCTAKELFNEKIKMLDTHNKVTGLKNQQELQKYLSFLSDPKNEKFLPTSLFFLDVDHFSKINAQYGFSVGDKCLLDLSKRFLSLVGAGVHLFHYGSDQFCFVLDKTKEQQDINVFYQKIKSIFDQSFCIENTVVKLNASVGVSVFPNDDAQIANVLFNAEMAMNKAKKLGRSNIQIGSVEFFQKNKLIKMLQLQIEQAFSNNEIFPFFQPIREARTQKIVGFETLLRWSHPEEGYINPETFIGIAEENGLIVEMGEKTIKDSLNFIKRCHEQGFQGLKIAINISRRQCFAKDFLKRIKKMIQASGVRPDLIEFELTETILVEDVLELNKLLQEIKKLGITLSIDDFGTGHSSLSILRALPFDHLKIDRSFVKDIHYNYQSLCFVGDIVKLAKNLDIKQIAEGVEYKEQWDLLEKLGCHYIQGYYGGKPMDECQAMNFLKDYSDKLEK